MENNKTNILFVDDDPNILSGIKRMLLPLKSKSNVYFAESGKEALQILSEHNIDIVISDMKMPVMDGADLLDTINKNYPECIRILLSGYSDNNLILKSMHSTHQFYYKPLSSESLKDSILKFIELKQYIKNEYLMRLVNSIDILPSIPELYLEIENELRAQNPSIRKLGDIVSQDIFMSAKILQIVNSAFFSLPKIVSDPIVAINYLGVDTIKSLVLFTKIFSPDNKIRQYSYSNLVHRKLWVHSLEIASKLKDIVFLETNNEGMASDAFFVGLLHDIGILVMSELDKYCENVHDMNHDFEYLTFEAKEFGVRHNIVGAYLLKLWNIPANIVNSVENHHNIDPTGDLILDTLKFIENRLYVTTEIDETTYNSFLAIFKNKQEVLNIINSSRII